MRNVTISLPDEIYQKAQSAADRREVSLSAYVRELLARSTDATTDFERRKQLQADSLASVTRFDASDRLSRDELYRR